MIWEPSEQVYSHSVGVCRALPLGSIAGNGYTLGKYDNDAAEHDRPRPKVPTANPTLGVALTWKVDTCVTARDGGNAGFAS